MSGAIRGIRRTFLLFVFSLLCSAIVALNAFSSRTATGDATPSYYSIRSETDKQRGIFTDNMVALIVVALAAVTLKAFPSLAFRQISILVFCCQEMINFVCDNALRTHHLKRSFGAFEFDVQPLTYATDSQVKVEIRHTNVPEGRMDCSRISFMTRIRPSDTIQVLFENGDSAEAFVDRTYSVFETSFDLPPIALRFRDYTYNGDNPVTKMHVTPNTSVFASSWNAIQYIMGIIGMRAMIVSLMSVFLLDSTERALDGYVSSYETSVPQSLRRYLPLLTLWFTSVFAALPINLLRFGWAYKPFGVQTEVTTSLVCLIFLLLSSVYLRNHTDEDEMILPRKTKTYTVLIGLCLLCLVSFLPDVKTCPMYLSDLMNESPLPAKLTFYLGGVLTVGILFSLVRAQLSLVMLGRV